MILNSKTILKEALLGIYELREIENIVKYYFNDRFGLPFGSQVELSESQKEVFNSDLSRFKLSEPYQYIVEKAYFYNRPFLVNKHTLIPRPETEELVQHCLHLMRSQISKSLNVLEVGTGSGCIAISLILEFKSELTVKALDISEEALKVALANVQTYDLDLELVQMDFLDESQWYKLGEFDIIVSNPPYISIEESNGMNDNVLKFEPHLALFSEDPLIFYKKIAKLGSMFLNKPTILCEINPSFKDETKGVFINGGFGTVNIVEDLQGKSRYLIAFP